MMCGQKVLPQDTHVHTSDAFLIPRGTVWGWASFLPKRPTHMPSLFEGQLLATELVVLARTGLELDPMLSYRGSCGKKRVFLTITVHFVVHDGGFLLCWFLLRGLENGNHLGKWVVCFGKLATCVTVLIQNQIKVGWAFLSQADAEVSAF